MIDKDTVNRILDAADIVDVVGDYVSLKRRGSNYVGLCPFHDEKTPSFSVSPSRQMCHCFGCGKGGSPVGFLMELEQMTYPEALRHLARKYNIEVHETEMNDEQRTAHTERESMLVLNDFACDFFEDRLHNTVDGRDIGLSYFRERGFTPATIKKFRLGYSPDNSTALYRAATAKGYSAKYLFETGLCIEDKRGGGFDRFRGRVMFPIFNVSGKVIAFGGRTLKNDPAKYFNSPESAVYVKNRELYGLFHAKRSIIKADCCYLVEGYTDVISMHQAGIENVVASSGTSLTEGQIVQIKRFTNNVTVLYDGDSAGIKASLRGIDMLLAAGLDIKVLLLPDGEDPDSYARSHSATEFTEFIAANQTDFIEFKTNILLKDAACDPTKRAAVIGDIVRSISVIPSEIKRTVYVNECSRRLSVAEDVLLREVARNIAHNRQEKYKQQERDRRRAELRQQHDGTQPVESRTSPPDGDFPPPDFMNPDEPGDYTRPPQEIIPQQQRRSTTESRLVMAQRDMAHYIARYGFCYLCQTAYDDGTVRDTTVIEFVSSEIETDQMQFTMPAYDRIYREAQRLLPDFYDDLGKKQRQLEERRADLFKGEVARIAASGESMARIEKLESEARTEIDARIEREMTEWRMLYLQRLLINSEDDEVRHTALELCNERYELSKIHTQFAHVDTEYEVLAQRVPFALNNWKTELINSRIDELARQITATVDPEALMPLLRQQQELMSLRNRLSKMIGERVVNPK